MAYACTNCYEYKSSPQKRSNVKNHLRLASIKILNSFLISKKAIQKHPLSFTVLVAIAVATIALAIFFILACLFPVAVPLLIPTGAALFLNGMTTSYLLAKFLLHRKEAGDDLFRKAHTVEQAISKEMKRDICLVIQAEEDSNGACYVHSEIQKLEKKYSLAIERVSDIWQINSAIEKIHARGSQIGCLWIIAHGSPSSIFLGKNRGGRITAHNASFLQAGFAKLAKEAPIVLDSCQTGTGNANIAKHLSLYSGSHPVFASKTVVGGGDIKVRKRRTPLHFKMRAPKWGMRAITRWDLFKNALCCLIVKLTPCTKKLLTENALVCYRQGAFA